ncbi:MAG: SDR family NAD-dependent epimerase/dehydratase, partial [Bacteroidia bacterium]|nr:SDR family NAD-dependent epimerase/dehydratase [Bacteroidia bacterium]
ILDFAKEILTLLPQSRSRIEFLPLPEDDPKVRRPDITLAQELLGWTPKVSRQEGLKRSIAYFQNKLSIPI